MEAEYLVMYDIASPKRLNHVARVLLDYGERVQKSVFELTLDETRLPGLIARLRSIVDENEDGIKIFKLCESCAQKRVGLGSFVEKTRDHPWMVL